MNFDLKVSQKLFWGQYFLKQSQKCIHQMVQKVKKIDSYLVFNGSKHFGLEVFLFILPLHHTDAAG